jgi:GH24 family phage-related lysozyme (muramidase)
MISHVQLSAADFAAIIDQISEGSAALDSWAQQAAGGFMLRDNAREYWAHLPSTRFLGEASRVARVTAYRDPAGRWTIGDVDVYVTTETNTTARADDGQEIEIVSAIESDPRKIVREESGAV